VPANRPSNNSATGKSGGTPNTSNNNVGKDIDEGGA
jgi:hypothetical protein